MYGLCLVLLLDASGSVDAAEYKLQREATAAALMSDEVIDRLRRGDGAIVSAIEFSGGQRIMVPWTPIIDKATAENFASALMGYVRQESGSTLSGDALLFSREYLNEAPACARKVVDLSADGWANGGAMVEEGVAALQNDGVMVNAIVINDETGVVEKYRDAVNGFTLEATWDTYRNAIKKKLNDEIAYHQPPSARYALEWRGDERYFAYGWSGGPSGPYIIPLYTTHITPPAYNTPNNVPGPAMGLVLGVALAGLGFYRSW